MPPPKSATRAIFFLLFLLSAAASGCQSVGQGSAPATRNPGPAAPPVQRPAAVAGQWNAVLRIDAEGAEISGILVLEQDGSALTGSFASPVGVNASGSGVVEGDRFTLSLSYDVECPGTLTLVGVVQARGEGLGGTITATDCTGEVRGSFSLTRGG